MEFMNMLIPSTKQSSVFLENNTIIISGKIEKETFDSFLKEYTKFDTNDDITIDLTTTGGESVFSYLFVRVLKKHKGKVTIKVPYYALSAGTIICLAADEIQVNSFSTFGGINVIDMGYGMEFNQLFEVAQEYLSKNTSDNSGLAELLSLFIKNKSDYEIKNHNQELDLILKSATNISSDFKQNWKLYTHSKLLDVDDIKKIFINIKDIEKKPEPVKTDMRDYASIMKEINSRITSESQE
jgi:membrane-bound ClpP family serine protease